MDAKIRVLGIREKEKREKRKEERGKRKEERGKE